MRIKSYSIIQKSRLLIMLLLLPACLNSVHAQVAGFTADVDKLYQLLQKTPSFKEQVTGDKLQEYENMLLMLKADSASVTTPYDVFYKLVTLFFPFKDNHFGFYQLPSNNAVTGPYPAVTLNTDSLEKVLRKKHADSVEGIYYYDNSLKVGLYRVPATTQLLGVVLSSTLPYWQKGQVAIRLYEYERGYFHAVYGHPMSKILMLYSNEKFRNHSLINSFFYGAGSGIYTKAPREKDYVNIKPGSPEFIFNNISPTVQYMHLGNFSADPLDMVISQSFCDSIKYVTQSSIIIADLRNNTGGAYKVSGKFLKLLQDFSTHGKVYALINNGTMSQGEIFALQLKNTAGATLLGQQTRGTIAYGSNFGRTVVLPSGRYQVYLSDMRDAGHHLQYENIGVTPDIFLNNDSDWLKQVDKIIRKK
jgi:hypothetical protein